MDLSIEIPQYSQDSYNNLCPPAPTKCHHHCFDWGIVDINFQPESERYNQQEIEDKYKELEEFIYAIDNSDKRSYKSHFQDNTRILVKRIIVNENIKRLYILTKNYNLWFRSHIDLLAEDVDGKYYDMSWN